MSDDTSPLFDLAKSAAIVFGATIIGHGIGLLAEILIVRSLDPDLYGRISFAFAIVSSLGSVCLLGINQGVARQYSVADDNVRQQKIVSAGFLVLLSAGTLASVGIFIFRVQISQLMGAVYLQDLLILFIPYLILFPLAQVTHAALRGQKRTLPAVLSKQVGGRGVAFIALIAFIFLGDSFYGAVSYWLGYPTVMLIISVAFIVKYTLEREPLYRTPDFSIVRRLWSFSWPLAIGTMVFLLLTQLDILMVGYFLSSEDVGYYRAVQPLKNAAIVALSAFSFLFLPIATEYFEANDYSGLNEIYTVTTKWVLLVTIPLILTFGFFSYSVVNVFFGEEYLPAVPVLSALVLGLFSRALTGLNGDMAKAIDQPRIELYSGMVGLVANFGLNVLLIPRYGIIGAALATVTGYLLYNGVEVLFIYNLIGVTPFSRNIGKITITMVGVAIILTYLIPQEVGLIELIGIGVFFGIIEPVILIGTKSVDEADLDLIVRLENKSGIDLAPVKRIIHKGL